MYCKPISGLLVTLSQKRLEMPQKLKCYRYRLKGSVLAVYLFESNRIKSKVAGAVSSITEETIVGSELFALRKDEPSGRYFVKIEIQGKKKEEQYTLTTEILLNNIKSVAEPLSGNAIRYKKLE